MLLLMLAELRDRMVQSAMRRRPRPSLHRMAVRPPLCSASSQFGGTLTFVVALGGALPSREPERGVWRQYPGRKMDEGGWNLSLVGGGFDNLQLVQKRQPDASVNIQNASGAVRRETVLGHPDKPGILVVERVGQIPFRLASCSELFLL